MYIYMKQTNWNHVNPKVLSTFPMKLNFAFLQNISIIMFLIFPKEIGPIHFSLEEQFHIFIGPCAYSLFLTDIHI